MNWQPLVSSYPFIKMALRKARSTSKGGSFAETFKIEKKDNCKIDVEMSSTQSTVS